MLIHLFHRRTLYVLVFLLVLGLPLVWQVVPAAATVVLPPDGTIPGVPFWLPQIFNDAVPGGTVPPGTVPSGPVDFFLPSVFK